MPVQEPEAGRRKGAPPAADSLIRRQLDALRDESALLARERDAALRQVRELTARKSCAEENARQVAAALEAATAQRDAALLCVDNLMVEASSVAQDLHTALSELERLKAEREALLLRVGELSDEVTALRAAAPAATGAPLAPALTDAPSPAATRLSAAADEFAATHLVFADTADGFFSASEGDDFFGAPHDPGAPALFLLQKGIPAIEYGSAEEIVELHHSINVSYVSAEGKGQETCKGYVACVKGSGGMRVYAALTSVESGKTWIYAPEEHPIDDESRSRLVRDALRFTEDVGFLMEPVLRGLPLPQHLDFIVRCPIFKAASMQY